MSEENPIGLIKVLAAGVMFAATVGCSLLGWLALSVNDLNANFASMRKELDINSPTDVLRRLDTIKEGQVSARDVEQIIRSMKLPWQEDKADWLKWRGSIDAKLDSMENKLHKSSVSLK